MPIHVHGGHVWVQMDAGEYIYAFGHGKEVNRVTRGFY